MNKTDIDWCDFSWNPVVGCYHGCPYCYARNMAKRFGGFDGYGCEGDFKNEGVYTLHDLKEPAYIKRGKEQKIFKAPFPFGFEPTILRYRLDEPKRMKKPSTIFVGSMTDLFGEWVPEEWISSVFTACEAAPWHRYLFLTKNPERYGQLISAGILPLRKNFWYGFSAENEVVARIRLDRMPWKHGYNVSLHKEEENFALNTFMSLEPLQSGINMGGLSEKLITYPQWVIIGAETGNRQEKLLPYRSDVMEIAKYCEEKEIPVFYKENLRKLFPELPESRFPWDTKNQRA